MYYISVDGRSPLCLSSWIYGYSVKYGVILARYGCRYTAAPQYVGFRGGLLRVYNVTALG
jgi:hypothetical protein